jgi:Protein of unknown function (DUF3179)
VWKAAVGGKTLTFHLTGINNQNFLMTDEETGSWWQQVSGEAIQGPMKGKRLEPVSQDEVTFAVWRQENPRSRVLRPDPRVVAKYASADWEQEIARLPTVGASDKRMPPRTLVVGVERDGASRAYPFTAVQKQSPLIDTVGRTPVVLVVAEDGRSVRVFDRRVEGRVVELFAKAGTLVDAQTGSEWNFAGVATRGPLAGRALTRVAFIKDYWFDWKNYHPATTVYSIGAR